MKSVIKTQLKQAILSRKETKTIKGGYDLFGGIGCSVPCCITLISPITNYPCQDGRKYYYGYTLSFNQITTCVKCGG